MPETASGILKRTKKGAGVLRDPKRSCLSGPSDIYVPARLIQRFDLEEGALVEGGLRNGNHQAELVNIRSIGGLNPAQFRKRTRFADLVAIDPRERFDLSATGDISMRVIDLMAPIGKGQRCLIVSPPKAGKTILLEKIANAIHESEPEARIVTLLIDERPEEVTQFRRATNTEVFASTSDQTSKEHVEMAELMASHVRIDLECGRDVVVLVDSLTRMGRAFNLEGGGSAKQGRSHGGGRTMSGGLEAGAMEIPRRFFGMARNVEGGGSVTIIASALVDTGSRMDELIFQEFKGTGNSEIVLDRSLAEARVFPAINILESGTRREERLVPEDQLKRIGLLRRALTGRGPREAMEMLLDRLEKTKTNEEFLEQISD